jgi:hypothetical protein
MKPKFIILILTAIVVLTTIFQIWKIFPGIFENLIFVEDSELDPSRIDKKISSIKKRIEKYSKQMSANERHMSDFLKISKSPGSIAIQFKEHNDKPSQLREKIGLLGDKIRNLNSLKLQKLKKSELENLDVEKIIEDFNLNKNKILSKIESLIEQKKFDEVDKELERYDIKELQLELLAIKQHYKERKLYEKVKPIPESNYAENLKLYKELLSLNRTNQTYKSKVDFYSDKINQKNNTDENLLSNECYELGYKLGLCATKSMHGIECEPENDIIIPEECRFKPETEEGIKAGIKKAYSLIF